MGKRGGGIGLGRRSSSSSGGATSSNGLGLLSLFKYEVITFY